MKAIHKILLLMGLVLLCLSLGACSRTKEAAMEDVTTTEVADQTEAATEVQTPEAVGGDPLSLPPYTYEVETADWDEEGVTIQYPVVVNSNVKGMAEGVNELIEKDLTQFIGEIKTNLEDTKGMTIDATYEYANSSGPVLSIQYLGTYFMDGAAYPVSFYHTITIYLPDLAVIPLSEIFNIDEAFVEIFKMGNYAPLRDDLDLEASGVNVQDLINQQYSNKELIELFSQPDADYFLADQGLILSVDVPHVIGDHLEMANTYESLEGNFKVDSPVWMDYNFLIDEGVSPRASE